MSTKTNLTASAVNKNGNKKQNKNDKNRVEKSMSLTENVPVKLSDLGLVKQTPSQTELLINNGRILSVIDEAIDKLQIAVNIKVLLQHNACRLRKCLPLAQVEYIQTACFKYLQRYPPPDVLRHRKYTQKISNIIEKISKNDFLGRNESDLVYHFPPEIDDVLDPCMMKAMEMMCSNNNLKTRALSEWCINQDPLSITLIKSMKNLRNAMEFRLSMNAVEEKKRQKSLRLALITNTSVLQKIKNTTEMLEDQRKSFMNELNSKQAITDDYLKRTERTNHMYHNKIKMTVAKSETIMFNGTIASDGLQAELAELSNNTTTMYENILNQHLKEEKELRKTRFKVETQLSSWLTKYDTDVGDRQAIFDELTEGYEAEKAEYDTLMEKFNEQNKEYIPLMVEKHEEEERIWEERFIIFLKTRACRRIQRYWRAYRIRKIARRKARRGKGKGKGGEKIKLPKRPQSKEKKGKGKGKKGKKDKKEGAAPTELRGPDLNAALDKKFGGDVFDNLEGGGFEKKDVEVDLLA